MKRLAVAAAAVLLLLPSLAACAGRVVEVGAVTVLISERTGSGMDAQSTGRLEVVGGCLGSGDSVVVWPHGTEVVDDDPLTLEIPDAGSFTLGDEVQIGGGYVLEHPSADVDPGPFDVAGLTVPAECAEYDIFLAR